MSAERLDTASRYQRLRMVHGKQSRALRVLVNLPEEKDKAYARSYHRSKNQEALRQYINKLMLVYDRHVNTEALHRFFGDAEEIERLCEGLKGIERDTYRAEELIKHICKNKLTTKDVAGLEIFRHLTAE
jgi:hypothetical protein